MLVVVIMIWLKTACVADIGREVVEGTDSGGEGTDLDDNVVARRARRTRK